MAINPETRYPGKIAAASSEYPYGQARNVSTPGDGQGTPFEADLVNDIFGFQQSLLSEAGITPSGTPDFVGASQYLAALKRVIFDTLYPVGEIMITLRSGNPSTWIGGGTWVRWGEGRALVGYNASDSDFNAAEKTGGAKTHTLTISEMPAHTHSISGRYGDGVTNEVDWGADAGQSTASTNTGSQGGGGAHNNLQPYITTFVWKRTA